MSERIRVGMWLDIIPQQFFPWFGWGDQANSQWPGDVYRQWCWCKCAEWKRNVKFKGKENWGDRDGYTGFRCGAVAVSIADVCGVVACSARHVCPLLLVFVVK